MNHSSRFPSPGMWFLGLLLSFALEGNLEAGNPIHLCESAQPYVWPTGGRAIPFNTDQGTLGPLSNAEAVALVQNGFNIWAEAPQSTMTSSNAGPLPLDVNADNFAEYLFASEPDGKSAIVFDADGQIFDLLFGANSGVLGFAGPEWIDPERCTIIEGLAFLNGPEFGNRQTALDIMVHEFGHYIGLGHTVVNGQILLGDDSGPTPFGIFGTPTLAQVETMYPFYFGSGTGFSSLERDDLCALATLYPDATFAGSTAVIRGVIRASDRSTPLSGVNVIARNLAQPFEDAVSAISGAYAMPSSPGDPMQGVYTLSGLTPGAQYVIYTDQITQGEFIREALFPFPGPEEFYNGTNETDNLSSPDPPDQYSPVSVFAGDFLTDMDIIFNGYQPGEPLPLGDEGYILLPLPFPFKLAGESYDSVFVNANGHLTFGAPPVGDDWDVNQRRLLDGPPRIAALWTDLVPNEGGTVTYEQTSNSFTVTYTDVPEWFSGGTNTFNITLHRGPNIITIEYEQITSEYFLAGVTGGRQVTSGSEEPMDLTTGNPARITLRHNPAAYEVFGPDHPVDLDGKTLNYAAMWGFNDYWAGPNDTLQHARMIALPFSSESVHRLTEIDPVGQDVDYYQFFLEAGEILVAEITSSAFDSMLGLFEARGGWNPHADGQLLITDDGPGRLSALVYRAPESGFYAIAVTATPDLDFQGHGVAGGRYVLNLKSVTPEPGEVVLNGGFELGEFLGWTAIATGTPYLPWRVTGAGLGGSWSMARTQPQEGEKVAWNGFDGAGPMDFLLYQNVSIPASGPAAVLRWKDRAQRFYFSFNAQPRVISAEFRDPDTDELIQTLHSYETGTSWGLKDSGWQEHLIDVSAHLGKRVRLVFRANIPQLYTGPGQYEIDSVSLKVGSKKILLPEPVELTITPAETGGLRLEWTDPSSTWILQECSNVAMDDWVDCSTPPLTLDSISYITLTPTNDCQFYRLEKR